MDPITITLIAEVDEKRRILVDLPDEVPVGKVTLTIQAVAATGPETGGLTSEQVRAKLIEAGLVSSTEKSPDALDIDDDELARLGKLFVGERPLSEVIIEDREDRA